MGKHKLWRRILGPRIYNWPSALWASEWVTSVGAASMGWGPEPGRGHSGSRRDREVKRKSPAERCRFLFRLPLLLNPTLATTPSHTDVPQCDIITGLVGNREPLDSPLQLPGLLWVRELPFTRNPRGRTSAAHPILVGVWIQCHASQRVCRVVSSPKHPGNPLRGEEWWEGLSVATPWLFRPGESRPSFSLVSQKNKKGEYWDTT